MSFVFLDRSDACCLLSDTSQDKFSMGKFLLDLSRLVWKEGSVEPSLAIGRWSINTMCCVTDGNAALALAQEFSNVQNGAALPATLAGVSKISSSGRASRSAEHSPPRSDETSSTDAASHRRSKRFGPLRRQPCARLVAASHAAAIPRLRTCMGIRPHQATTLSTISTCIGRHICEGGVAAPLQPRAFLSRCWEGRR